MLEVLILTFRMSKIEYLKGIIPSSAFSGILSERNYVALTLIFIEQFLSVFAPVVTRFLSFIQVLCFPCRDEVDGVDSNNSDYTDTNVDVNEKRAPIVSKTYARFIDDKKPTVGTKSDVKKLEDFGFDKYRYLSKSFMKRNNIVREKD